MTTLPRLAAALAAVALLLTPHAAAEPVDAELKREFLEFAERKIPAKGTVVVVMEPEEDNRFGRTIYAYDAETRAWHLISYANASGRDAQGRRVISRQAGGDGSVRHLPIRPGIPVEVVHDDSAPSAPPTGVAGVLLNVMLVMYLEQPERIEHLQRLENGVWIVGVSRPVVRTARLPEDEHARARVYRDATIHFSAINPDGLLLRTWRSGTSAFDRDYEVWEDSPEGFPIATPRPTSSGTRIYSHVEVIPGGDPERFSVERVSEILEENLEKISEQRRTRGLQRHVRELGDE